MLTFLQALKAWGGFLSELFSLFGEWWPNMEIWEKLKYHLPKISQIVTLLAKWIPRMFPRRFTTDEGAPDYGWLDAKLRYEESERSSTLSDHEQ